MKILTFKDLILFLAIVAFGTMLCIGLVFFVNGLSREARGTASTHPDSIATGTTTLGNIIIEDKTGNYAIATPPDWRLERSSGSGLAIYAASSSLGAPFCKVEISKLQNPSRRDLSVWLTAYLHTDPTTDEEEISRDQITVAGAPAVVWTGTLNGVSSTLVYVATGTAVYEFAPSVVAASGSGETVPPACVDALGKIVTTFQWLP